MSDEPVWTDAELEEDIIRAVARIWYERVTGQDWHLAEMTGHDPGLDPYWREMAAERRRDG